MNTDLQLKLLEIIQDTEPEKELFVPGETYIRPSGAIISTEDVLTLMQCALERWYTEGKYAKEFAHQIRKFLQDRVRSVVLCNSGSSANLLALSTITSYKFKGIRANRGDEIITTAASFPTTVNGIIQNGMTPVFIDVELGTYVPTPDAVEKAITDKTKGIILTHTLGNTLEIEAIRNIAEEYNLWLIEDCCDAFGSIYKDQMVGTFGDMATFSFFPAHMITTAEGGAIVSRSPMVEKILRSFKDWGHDCWCLPGEDNTCGKRFSQQFGKLPEGYDHKYTYTHIGYNLKMTDLQAALGSSQIHRLDEFVERRRENFNKIWSVLEFLSPYFVLPKTTAYSNPAWFGFPLTLKRHLVEFTCNDVIAYLEDHRIGTRRLFAGNILDHPAYFDIPHRIDGKLHNTKLIAENTFWIGVWPGITEQMIYYIGMVFHKFIREYAK